MARILIVEDDEAVRGLTARALAADGHGVDEAVDGEHGLECLRAAGQPYDLILSDIRMPTMDGIEMALAAVEIAPATPVLFMTGFAEQRARVAELGRRTAGVVDKPFTLPQIRERVRQALG